MESPENLEGTEDLERIMEIPLEIQVELGRQRMRISKLLAMQPGSVLELEAQAGSPLAVYANRTLIAHGEAVMIGDRYGVRITQIVSAAERVRRLGGRVEEGV